MGKIDKYTRYQERIMDNIDYETLVDKYDKGDLDELVAIAVEALCTNKDSLRICGEDKPTSVVKSQLLKLDFTHIEYVMDSLSKNTTKIRNIKSYLLTTLYNAAITINSYYQAEANFGLYGQRAI